jgi:peptidoglycan hydrolase-like protein with peptidoglycan-binding domain
MSSATDSKIAVDTVEVPAAPRGAGRRRARRRVAAALAVLVLAGAGVGVVLAHPFSGRKSPPGGVADNAAPTSLATITRRTLTSQTAVDGTLGFAGTYSVVNPATGAVTALPGLGQVIRRGQVLYRVAGKSVLLLYGGTPAYRALKEGMSGRDVRQLNANLVALGYATSAELDPTSGYFSWATKYALEQLQHALGTKATGTLDLGRAVFLPGAARITKVMTTLGTMAQPGVVIAQASSTRRQVLVDLSADQQSSVKVGDRVMITLPNNRTTPGVVTSVGKVANGSSGSATVTVHIAPRKPKVTGSLDRATVQVAITTARVKRALVVPATALLALASGGYAVEAVGAGGVRHLVPVTLGLFDDADGLVQVSGSLSAGERIVVPAP